MYVVMVRIQYRMNASSPPIGFGKDISLGGVGTLRVVLVKEEVQSQVEVFSLYGQTCVCVCMGGGGGKKGKFFFPPVELLCFPSLIFHI